jgi:histidinol-phosphate/aromatic aminotransferase/cobyric acid decarboxylase-like protein
MASTLQVRNGDADSLQDARARTRIAIATPEERKEIYAIRHEVYAAEIGQHRPNAGAALTDALDAQNFYIAASSGDEILGFISITPPSSPSFSVDKYFPRADMPFAWDEHLYEVRLLTIRKSHRSRQLAMLLMYAALRWIEDHGGMRIVAIGRREVLSLYVKVGLEPLGRSVQSGEVTFELLTATTECLRARCSALASLFMRTHRMIDWQLPVPFFPAAKCFHGGAFFEAIGEEFDSLERSRDVVNADVLDAWFPPSPRVLSAIREYLPWLAKTSPPTNCEGLVRAISAARGVPPECVVPGAGSSDLIYRALRNWVAPASRVLVPDPTYGEYVHVLEQVVGCQVDRIPLQRENAYRLSPADLESAARQHEYDLIVLVNPNSPTGHFLGGEELGAVLRRIPQKTVVWIDETYIDYAGASESLEKFAARSHNIVICKSMSKVYALSGLRAAYLCAPPHLARAILAITPPWVVSLPAQVAAVNALRDPGYYAQRYAETHAYCSELVGMLRSIEGIDVLEGVANFVLCHLDPALPSAAEICERCRAQKIFLRDLSSLSKQLGTHALRIAVKDRQTNERIVEVLKAALESSGSGAAIRRSTSVQGQRSPF